MKKTLEFLNYQPSALLEHEMNEPKGVLVNFFGNDKLQKRRATIWELYCAWVNDAVAYAEPEDYAEMLWFYMEFNKLLDALLPNFK